MHFFYYQATFAIAKLFSRFSEKKREHNYTMRFSNQFSKCSHRLQAYTLNSLSSILPWFYLIKWNFVKSHRSFMKKIRRRCGWRSLKRCGYVVCDIVITDSLVTRFNPSQWTSEKYTFSYCDIHKKGDNMIGYRTGYSGLPLVVGSHRQ